jgi:hypothetical protein
MQSGAVLLCWLDMAGPSTGSRDTVPMIRRPPSLFGMCRFPYLRHRVRSRGLGFHKMCAGSPWRRIHRKNSSPLRKNCSVGIISNMCGFGQRFKSVCGFIKRTTTPIRPTSPPQRSEQEDREEPELTPGAVPAFGRISATRRPFGWSCPADAKVNRLHEVRQRIHIRVDGQVAFGNCTLHTGHSDIQLSLFFVSRPPRLAG